MESWETIARQSLMMVQRTCSPAEYQRMVTEKAAAMQLSGLAMLRGRGKRQYVGRPAFFPEAAVQVTHGDVVSDQDIDFAAKHRSPETDRTFRESIGTFRRMSLAEIEDAKPLRLQVVTVAPSDTVEKLATRMAVADRPVERFRVLNGLDPGDRLKSGSEVKIVVE